MNASRLKLLTPRQKQLLRWVLLGAAFMVANSAYLAWAGHGDGVGDDPYHLPTTYQVILIAHIAVGLALFLPALFFAAWHLKRALLRRRKGSVPSGASVLFLMTFLLFSGLFILTAANTRENRWAFLGHQITAVMLPLAYALHRWLGKDRPPRTLLLRWVGGMLAVAAIMLAAHLLEGRGRAPLRGGPPTSLSVDLYAGGSGDPVGAPNPESPFFPSPVTTTTGGFLSARILHKGDLPDLSVFHRETNEYGFSASQSLGAESCARCHPDIVAQWEVSAHRFASFNNPFYRRSVELTRETAGKQASQWCGGCHDPAIMMAGNMMKDIDPLTPESQAGLTCMACHAIDQIHSQVGNGHYNIQDATPSPYLFDESKDGIGRFLHDYALKAKPNVHKAEMLKPFFRESIFCSVCHKVSLDVPVNNYRWFRGQNEYDAWHNTGVIHNNPMTWYEPPATKNCQDCHMQHEPAILGDLAAKKGKVRSHRFLSVNTALPYIRGDQDSIDRIEQDLQDEKLRLDLFALRRGDRLIATALNKTRPRVAPGDELQLDVVVRNLGVGHTFPGGTNDSNEGWLEVKVSGDSGVLWHHGGLREDKHVDPRAHFYKAVIVDRHGQRIAKRNAADIYTVVYANVIPPSTSDIARYAFTVPKDWKGPVRIDVALKWRKFNREFTEFVYEGKEVPDLPITVIESASIELLCGEDATETPLHSADAADWMRYNDNGIGSILDGDTRTAHFAFRQVIQLVPEKVDGYRNQARAFLRDGALREADDALRRATDIAPNEARTAFFWGRIHEEQGGDALTHAVEAYRRTLEAYPESRDTWDRLGRVLMQLDRLAEAQKCYEQVLKIDPESALAHERMGQILAAMADRAPHEDERAKLLEGAEIAKRLFEKYKQDENADQVTLKYRQAHPHDQHMSQQLIIHRQDP